MFYLKKSISKNDKEDAIEKYEENNVQFNFYTIFNYFYKLNKNNFFQKKNIINYLFESQIYSYFFTSLFQLTFNIDFLQLGINCIE